MSKRISTSFNEAQIVLMNEILSKLLSGSDPKLLIRNKAFPSLMASMQSLKRRIDNPTPPRAVTLVPSPDDAGPDSTHPSEAAVEPPAA